MMKQLSTKDRNAKTRRQIELVETALTKQFPTLSAGVVHREVTTVSEELLASARFTDHVAVLTGRFVAEHLEANEPPWKQNLKEPASSGGSAPASYALFEPGELEIGTRVVLTSRRLLP